jgi:uncharacterized membrane protein YedE/YeeE
VIGALVPLIVLLLAASLLLVLQLSGGGGEPARIVPHAVRHAADRLIESEREFASGLGWPHRRWFLVRGLVLVLGIVVGLWSGVPVLIGLDVLLGLTVLRFVFGALADRRRVQQARAFLTFMSQVADRLSARNLELSWVVRAAAREVPHEVSALLQPVAAAGQDVFEVLVQQMERARSAPLERFCTIMLANRECDLNMVARLITAEVATLETELDGEDRRVAERAESRWTILFMGGVVVGFAAILNGVPAMHAIFLSARGQLGLISSMAIFAVTALVMTLLLRSPGMSRWDLTRMHRELLGGGGDFGNGRRAK